MATLSSGTTVAGSTALHANNYGNVLYRGNPGSGNTLLLDVLDGAHFYTATNVSTMSVPTTMVENAVYEVQYGTTTSGSNIDIILFPNFTTYASQFTVKYWSSMPSATPSWFEFNQTFSYFYFDHQNGAAGTNPKGKWTIFNFRARKLITYHGGDDNSVTIGTGRWNNSSNQWLNVGDIGGLNSTGEIWVMVRRIG